jgi:protein phosphatase PTC1
VTKISEANVVSDHSETQIWDVLDDQTACQLVRTIADPQVAAKTLVQEATQRYTNDNITVMVIRLKDVPSDLES